MARTVRAMGKDKRSIEDAEVKKEERVTTSLEHGIGDMVEKKLPASPLSHRECPAFVKDVINSERVLKKVETIDTQSK